MSTSRDNLSPHTAVTPLHRYDDSKARAGGCFRTHGVTPRNSSSRVWGAELRVILGPPGCGKTTRLLTMLDDELSDGLSPRRIACVTFTRAARRQVQERLGRRLSDFPWIRTLHSAAYRLLDLSRDRILADERWAEFAERHGYRLSDVPGVGDLDNAPQKLPAQTPDDLVRAAYSWGRCRRLDLERTLAKYPAPLSASRLQLFWRRIEAFKAEHQLLDFSDLLEETKRKKLHPDIDVLFVDEAQDLSAQEIALVEAWAAACSRVYVAGDEDQAIYGFRGADPSWLLELAKHGDPEVLRQSYRVPAEIHALARRIIHQNRERVPKEYKPRDATGRVRSLDTAAAMVAVDGTRSTFVLARNRTYLGRWTRELIERGVPFVVEGRGGVSPLSSGRARSAVELALRLHSGLREQDRITAAELAALLAYVPSATGLIPRGTKARMREERISGRAFTVTELRQELGLADLLDRIVREGALTQLAGLHPQHRTYFETLIRRHGTLPEPLVTLTSIHGAKGREADLVVLLPDLTRSTERELLGGAAGREAENRVFYVAVTRALEELIIVAPRGRRHYRFPSLRSEGDG